MFEICILITGAIVLVSMVVGYQRTKDPLSPTIVFGPLLAYVYVYSPVTLLWNGGLVRRFVDHDLSFVGLVNLIGVAAFCLGLISYSAPRGWAGRTLQLPQFRIAPQKRKQILSMARLLGAVAVLGFAYLVYVSGGPVDVFTRPKPFLVASSGYLGELPMLSLPALFLMAIALQGQRLKPRHYLAAFFVTSPHLVMGTLGGRRGVSGRLLVGRLLVLGAQQTPFHTSRPMWRCGDGAVYVVPGFESPERLYRLGQKCRLRGFLEASHRARTRGFETPIGTGIYRWGGDDCDVGPPSTILLGTALPDSSRRTPHSETDLAHEVRRHRYGLDAPCPRIIRLFAKRMVRCLWFCTAIGISGRDGRGLVPGVLVRVVYLLLCGGAFVQFCLVSLADARPLLEFDLFRHDRPVGPPGGAEHDCVDLPGADPDRAGLGSVAIRPRTIEQTAGRSPSSTALVRASRRPCAPGTSGSPA